MATPNSLALLIQAAKKLQDGECSYGAFSELLELFAQDASDDELARLASWIINREGTL